MDGFNYWYGEPPSVDRQDMEEWLERSEGGAWKSKYRNQTTESTKTSTHSVGIQAIYEKGTRLAVALGSKLTGRSSEYSSDRTEYLATWEPSHTAMVPHFREWLGFQQHRKTDGTDHLGIRLAFEPMKFENQLVEFPLVDLTAQLQPGPEELDIQGLLDDKAIGSMLAKIEDVPLNTALSEIPFIQQASYCRLEDIDKIVNSPHWQAALRLMSSLPGVADYHQWISYIWRSNARQAYHQMATNMWLFQSQTKQRKRLDDGSVMVPRANETQELRRRYLASQAFCWLAKATEHTEEFWKTIYSKDIEDNLRCLFGTTYHHPDWVEFLKQLRSMEKEEDDLWAQETALGQTVRERVRLGRDTLGHIIRRQGWIAAQVSTNKGILLGGISLIQNKLITGFILQLNSARKGLGLCSAIPSILTQLRVLLGDAHFYEPEWINFLHFIRSYQRPEITRAMHVLADLDQLEVVCQAWRSISAKMERRHQRYSDAVLVIPKSISTPSELETFCRVQHCRLMHVLAAPSVREALALVPLEERFAWRAVTAWKSQNPSPTLLAKLDQTCPPARLNIQLEHLRTSLQISSRRKKTLEELWPKKDALEALAKDVPVVAHRSSWVLGPLDLTAEAPSISPTEAVPDGSLAEQADFLFAGSSLTNGQCTLLPPRDLLIRGTPELPHNCLKAAQKITNFELDAWTHHFNHTSVNGLFLSPITVNKIASTYLTVFAVGAANTLSRPFESVSTSNTGIHACPFTPSRLF